MTEEFNLSDKIYGQISLLQKDLDDLRKYRKEHLKSAVKGIIEQQNEAAISNLNKVAEDVKEFIKRLKEELRDCVPNVLIFQKINALAGEKLI
jgi:hypothetical protein